MSACNVWLACTNVSSRHVEKVIGTARKALHVATVQFIGEEGSALSGTAELTDEPTWMVDPLDGTTNFVHRYGNTTDCTPKTHRLQRTCRRLLTF
jgi:hypothetical protein